mgnify:CR=1 FL=1
MHHRRSRACDATTHRLRLSGVLAYSGCQLGQGRVETQIEQASQHRLLGDAHERWGLVHGDCNGCNHENTINANRWKGKRLTSAELEPLAVALLLNRSACAFTSGFTSGFCFAVAPPVPGAGRGLGGGALPGGASLAPGSEADTYRFSKLC